MIWNDLGRCLIDLILQVYAGDVGMILDLRCMVQERLSVCLVSRALSFHFLGFDGNCP